MTATPITDGADRDADARPVVSAHVPPAPPWMADLPPLHHPRSRAFHNQPTLAAGQWQAGKPIFGIDQRKARMLGIRCRCFQCGYPIPATSYLIRTETDTPGLLPGGLHTQAFGPLHRSCALYAAAGACPFLRYGKSRRRLTDHTMRGNAQIIGFTDCAVVFPKGHIDWMCFGYFGHLERIPLANRELIDELYAQAIRADDKLNFTATDPLHWTDSPPDLQRLNTMWTHDINTLRAWAQTSIVTVNGYRYRGHTLKPISA